MKSTREEQLERLRSLADEDIDLSDIPEVIDWAEAERGKYYRPKKKAISLRVDMDVLHWFKTQQGPYQTRMNEALREYVSKHRRAAAD